MFIIIMCSLRCFIIFWRKRQKIYAYTHNSYVHRELLMSYCTWFLNYRQINNENMCISHNACFIRCNIIIKNVELKGFAPYVLVGSL